MSSLDSQKSVVRVIIPGKYWDSQLYSDQLFLFGRSGELIIASWSDLVAQLPAPVELNVVMKLALLGNHHLYETGARLLVSDPEVKKLLRRKFDDLCSHSPWRLDLFQAAIQDNPFPFPHNDSDVHYQRLIVAGSDGLFSSPTSGDKGSTRLSEVPTFTIAAKFHTIAQAAGDEGLFAVDMPGGYLDARAKRPGSMQVCEIPCNSCEWGSTGVIASGFDNRIYIAPYNEARGRRNMPGMRPERNFQPIISEPEIFGDDESGARGYAWGAGDKIFRFENGHIGVIRLESRHRAAKFSRLGTLDLQHFTDNQVIVAARTSAFGSVIEFDDGLLVMLTQGGLLNIAGEPTNWRVFPRSSNYLNHLHIVYEDRLEIWAFTHDYFVDQDARLAGLTGI